MPWRLTAVIFLLSLLVGAVATPLVGPRAPSLPADTERLLAALADGSTELLRRVGALEPA